MKVLIVGSAAPIALESIYADHLRSAGMAVDIYPIKDIVRNKSANSTSFKVALRLNLFLVLRSDNKKLLAYIEKTEPDIIWVFKGMYVLPNTLKQIKRNILLVNYNPDHPFVFSSRGSGNSNVKKSIGLYDLHLYYHNGVRQLLEDKCSLKTAMLPFGFELSAELYTELLQQEEVKKVCFIGNSDKKRIKTIEWIANNNIEVDIYGYGWQNTSLRNNKNIALFDPLYGADFWRGLRKYRVQVNIFREHNKGSHNMRTFEIPACGGIQVSPFSSEQAGFFKEDSEIFFYRSKQELICQIKRLMLASSDEIGQIRLNARERSVSSGYSYASRAESVKKIFQSYV